jgi:hypothetical protein
MDLLTIILRIAHIGLGAVWVGMMFMNVVFLSPIMREIGPGAGPVMQGLQRRKFMIFMPVVALLTIIAGAWLVFRVWGGFGPIMDSRAGQMLMVGATLAILAFLMGVIVMRPIMMKSAALAQSGRPEDRAELEKLRDKGSVLSWVILTMLLLATAAMAVARYVPN